MQFVACFITHVNRWWSSNLTCSCSWNQIYQEPAFRTIFQNSIGLRTIQKKCFFCLNTQRTWGMMSFMFLKVFYFISYLSRARRTPSLSTRSWLSLRPAVSIKRTGNPPMSNAVSTMSLVVPAMGDTMAAGLWPVCKEVKGWQPVYYYCSYRQKKKITKTLTISTISSKKFYTSKRWCIKCKKTNANLIKPYFIHKNIQC